MPQGRKRRFGDQVACFCPDPQKGGRGDTEQPPTSHQAAPGEALEHLLNVLNKASALPHRASKGARSWGREGGVGAGAPGEGAPRGEGQLPPALEAKSHPVEQHSLVSHSTNLRSP